MQPDMGKDDLGGRHFWGFIWGFNVSRLYLSQRPCGSWLFCSQPCKTILSTIYYNILNFLFGTSRSLICLKQEKSHLRKGLLRFPRHYEKARYSLPCLQYCMKFSQIFYTIVSGVVLKNGLEKMKLQ